MVSNILELLKIAVEQNKGGEYIDVALGKYKFPETIKEGVTLAKRHYGSR